ncbi:hypothetical protein B0H21DRAFT_826108 [Amylocystis lapponica]|nr:hypothetical protein B0H21DRAFT_826108 [Amylocystis lapponica]
MASRKKTKSALSSHVTIRTATGIGRARTTVNYRLTESRQWRALAAQVRREQVAGMSFEERNVYNDLGGQGDIAMDDDNDDTMHQLPPGEEAMFFSHARGEEELCREIFEAGRKPKRKDARTRRDRTEARNKEWLEQREDLVEAYMQWQANIPLAEVAESVESPSFVMYTVDFFNTDVRTFTIIGSAARTNITLARYGYIGTAPIYPTTALSFQSSTASAHS